MFTGSVIALDRATTPDHNIVPDHATAPVHASTTPRRQPHLDHATAPGHASTTPWRLDFYFHFSGEDLRLRWPHHFPRGTGQEAGTVHSPEPPSLSLRKAALGLSLSCRIPKQGSKKPLPHSKTGPKSSDAGPE